MHFNFKWVALTACVAFFAGCGLTSGSRSISGKSARHVYLSGSQIEASHYVELYEVSIKSLKEHEEHLLKITTKIADRILDVGKDCDEIKHIIPAIADSAKDIYTHRTNIISKLEKNYDAKTDSILFYEYMDSKRQEFGWMVVAGSRLKYKLILGEGVAP